MKKQIINYLKRTKKYTSRLIAKGIFKEKLKSVYYSLLSTKAQFSVVSGEPLLFQTIYGKLKFLSIIPLYKVVFDFDYYQHFYKIKKGDYIIDAGANQGYLSIFFSKLTGPTGKVFAFEPDSINISYINKNISINDDLDDNIIINDSLLWNENTEIDFYEAGISGSSAIYFPDREKVVKKQTVTIDSWAAANNIPKIDFIKMDIEGAEIEAIEGCTEVIAKFKPNFAIASYHLVNGEQTYIKLEDFFKSINYPFKTVTLGEFEVMTFAGVNLK